MKSSPIAIQPITDKTQKLRNDIQVLRGFAVLIVLFYHAKIGFFHAGYLGVDVFFVISGFLITRLVKDGIERGDFTLSQFYFRRAKRLLPAAYVTFFGTIFLAPFFLASSELNDFRTQLAGAVTFTANFALWQQSGYFQGAADLKPLLHIWSLAIEEQYYFLLPASMVFTPRRYWKSASVIAAIASFTLCMFMVDIKPIATFYLLPTRGWELAIGSAGAFLSAGYRLRRIAAFMFWPAVILMLSLPAISLSSHHPGLDALLVCLATLVVLLREHPLLMRGPVVHIMSRVGDISYSLYLVHWPIFAFLANSWVGGDEISDIPLYLRFGLLLMALFLGYLLNRYVEEPVRWARIKVSTRVLLPTLATSLAMIVVTFAIGRNASGPDYAFIRRVNFGMNESCEFQSEFSPIPACRNSEAPAILVWGDSYAMHLVPGILGDHRSDASPTIVQATRSSCGPLLDVAPVERRFVRGYNTYWAERCIAFNDSVIRYLEQTDSIRTVVLSSPFSQYLENGSYQLIKRGDSEHPLLTLDAGLLPAIAGVKATVKRVRALGKTIIVIAPPPQGTFNIGKCLERMRSGLVVLGGVRDCKIDLELYKKNSAVVLQLLDALPKMANVEVIGFDSYLCQTVWCETFIDGTFVYRDSGHFSYEGSVLLSKRSGLLERIYRAAR